MSREDLSRLLGAFAAGTLSPEEQRVLFEAALEDQDLFDALAREEALRDTLADTVQRRRVLEALESGSPSWAERLREWLARPQPWALAGGGVAVAVLAVLIVRVTVPEPPTAGPLVAQRTAAPAPEQRPATRPAQPAPAAPSEAPARVEAKRKQAPQRVPSAAAEVEEQRREAEAVPPPPALESTVRLAETRPVAPQEPVPPLPPAERPPAQAIAMRSASDQAAPSPRDLYYLSLAVRQESTRFAPSAARSARAGAGGVVGGVPAVPGVLGLRYSWAEGRLVVEANTSAYLEISAGRRRVVSRQTEPQRRYTIEVPGEETRLKLILSRRQRADAAELDRPAGQRAAGADGAVYVVVADAGPDAYLAVEVPVPAGR